MIKDKKFEEIYKPDYSKMSETFEDITLEQYKYMIEELYMSGAMIELIYNQKPRKAEQLQKKYKNLVKFNRLKATELSNLYHFGVKSTNSLKSTRDKVIQTMNDRYGGWFTKTDEYKDKSQETCQLKYGVDFTSQIEGRNEKVKATNLKNCGYESNLQNPDFIEHTKQVKLERYGNANYVNSEKAKQTKINKYNNINYNNKEQIIETWKNKSNEEKQKIVQKRKNTKLKLYGYENYTNREQYQETLQEKYGVSNIFQLEEVKEKSKSTNILKYGVEYYSQFDEFKTKLKQTKLEKYGNENYNNIEQIKSTKLNRYGDENYNNQDKIRNTLKTKYGRESIAQIGISDESIQILHSKEQFVDLITNFIAQYQRKPKTIELANQLGYGHSAVSKAIAEYNLQDFIDSQSIVSYGESQLKEYIKSIYKGNIIFNDRIRLEGKEIDILLPDLNIGFEYNGEYWHQDSLKDLSKYNLAKMKGIELYFIWESQWKLQQDKIKNWLSNMLVDRQRIFARKCQVRELNKQEFEEFNNDNHLQILKKIGGVYIGLFYNNILVSAMYFSSPNHSNKYEWELIRFCNKVGYQVIGGASKLFKFFIKMYHPKNIVSYQDTNRFRGNVYSILGFERISVSKTHLWSNGEVILPRQITQRKNLLDILPEESESAYMIRKGFCLIDRLPKITWVWNNIELIS